MTDFREIVDVNAIKKALSDPDEFISFLKNIASENDDQHLIRVLKVSEILVEMYPSGKYKLLKQKVISYLGSQYKDSILVANFLKEVNFLQKLYDKLFEMIAECELAIPEDLRLGSLLMAIEMYFSTHSSSYLNVSKELIEGLYGFDMLEEPSIMDIAGQTELTNLKVGLEENIVNLQHGLRYIMRRHGEKINLCGDYNEKLIYDAFQYITLLNHKYSIDHVYELWVFLDAKIVPDDTMCNAKVDLDGNDTYKAWVLSNTRKRISLRNNITSNEENFIINKNSKRLPPLEFISKVEHRSYVNTMACFYSNLNVKYHEISLQAWLRAYSNLKDIADRGLLFRLNSNTLHGNFNKLFKSKSKKRWVDLLARRGVAHYAASRIFECWVFNGKYKNKKSDLFEQPFYMVSDDQFVLFASIAREIEPSVCMLNLFKNTGEFNVNKNQNKGNLYENMISQSARKSEVQFISPKLKDEKNMIEAEYDFLLRIENDIFLIEAKSKIDLFTFNEHYGFYSEIANQHIPKLNKSKEKLIRAIPKLRMKNETYNKFFSNADSLNFTNIILSSVRLGEPIFYDGCYVTDFHNLIDIFENRDIGVKCPDGNVVHLYKSIPCKLQERMHLGLRESRAIKFLEKTLDEKIVRLPILDCHVEVLIIHSSLPDEYLFEPTDLEAYL